MNTQFIFDMMMNTTLNNISNFTPPVRTAVQPTLPAKRKGLKELTSNELNILANKKPVNTRRINL